MTTDVADPTVPKQPGDPGYLTPGLLTAGTPAPSVAAGYTPTAGTATPAASASYDPQKYAVSNEGTVQGQIKNVIADDSPLMQQARTRANQDAQQRGLLSSSLAVGAGQQAVLNAALPIAQQDASIYNTAMTNTANAQNAARQFSAAATTDVSKTNAGLLTNTSVANAHEANVANQTGVAAVNQQALQLMDSKSKEMLANIDGQYRQLLQTNQSAGQMYQQATTSIANIANNKDLTPEAKTAATTTQINLLNEGLQTIAAVASTEHAAVTNLNLSQYFTTDQPTGAIGTTTLSAGVPLTNGQFVGKDNLMYPTLALAQASLKPPTAGEPAPAPGTPIPKGVTTVNAPPPPPPPPKPPQQYKMPLVDYRGR